MSKKGTGKFVLGAALGALAGIIFAPKSGRETRIALKEKAEELINKAKEIEPEEVREEIEKKTKQIVSELSDLDREKAEKLAKEKADKLKKDAEDLVKYAKEKATPIVNEAAENLRQKAISATKCVLDKLEEK